MRLLNKINGNQALGERRVAGRKTSLLMKYTKRVDN